MRHGGFVVGAQLFDNAAFGISTAEAAAMDPQQRLLLESGWAALYGAGMTRSTLAGSLTGVFVAITSDDFARLAPATRAGATGAADGVPTSAYSTTGTSHAIAAGRLSFVLGLHGPCAAYDTACSSGLVATHAAFLALQYGETSRALVAATNLMLLPDTGVSFAVAGLTSALGRSHTFDARTDGYVRAEACASVVLAPSDSAAHAELPSHIGLIGSSVRHDGRSASLTAPHGLAQQGLLAGALADAAITPERLGFVEAHGTGTALGDPLEVRALVATLLAPRTGYGSQLSAARSRSPVSQPLLLGGAKASYGHSEAAAGLTGLLQITLALEHSLAPPNAQLRRLQPDIGDALAGVAAHMPTQLAPLFTAACRHKDPRMRSAGVSSFGFGGTIAHAILQTDTDRSDRITSRNAFNVSPDYRRRAFSLKPSNRAKPLTPSSELERLAPRTHVYSTCWSSVPQVPQVSPGSFPEVSPMGLATPSSAPFDAQPETQRWLVLTLAANERFVSDGLHSLEPRNRWRRGALISATAGPHRSLGGEGTAPPSAPPDAPPHLVLFLGDAHTAKPSSYALIAAFELLTVSCSQQPPTPSRPSLCVLVTRGCLAPAPLSAMPLTPALGGASGLARVLRAEEPRALAHCVDLAAAVDGAAALETILTLISQITPISRGTTESQWVVDHGKVYAARLRRRCRGLRGAHARVDCHVILGGLGGLGLLAGSLLLRQGAPGLLLTSRTGRVARGEIPLEFELAALRERTAAVGILAADASSALDVRAVAAQQPASSLIHAAGFLHSTLLTQESPRAFRAAMAPKSLGAYHAHAAWLRCQLDASIFLSSTASILGNIGQGAYAAANSALDALAGFRAARGLVAASLQLPLVSDTGVGAAILRVHHREYRGMLAVSAGAALACLRDTLLLGIRRPHAEALLPASATRELYPELFSSGPLEVAEMTTLGMGTSELGELQDLTEGDELETLVLESLHELSTHTLHLDYADASANAATVPFLESGLDSLGATELIVRLRARSGLALSATAVFEHPTPRALARHMRGLRTDMSSATPARMSPGEMRPSRLHDVQPVFSGGGASQWPGVPRSGCRGALHRLLLASGDAVGFVPALRWRAEEAAVLAQRAGTAGTAALRCMRHGGFIAEADRFDNELFGVSPAESAAMDPQQRLLLECGYEALHQTGVRCAICTYSPLKSPCAASGQSAGVFVGVESSEWALVNILSRSPPSVFQVTSSSGAIAAGRLAFTLNLNGPCMACDASCASALVALHCAASAITRGEYSLSLAASASLKLLPYNALNASIAGMLSSDGRCRSFDALANGYVRSEGLAAIALATPAFDAHASGSRLCRSVVQQDGRSASLTAPNGSAQHELLVAAMRGEADSVATIEAHGTGTALGDPTEIGALVNACLSLGARQMAVEAAKANIGHSEAVSGLLGVVKALGGARDPLLFGNAQLNRINPFAREAMLKQTYPIALHVQNGSARKNHRPSSETRHGVSSFGYNGTIVHATLGLTCSGATRPGAAHLGRAGRGGQGGGMGGGLAYRRHLFQWREPTHPLVQCQLADGASDVVHFRAADEDSLRALIADHIVQGHLVFPGAGYLEMARAGLEMTRARCGLARRSQLASLKQVCFLRPLLMNEMAGSCLELELKLNGGQLHVRSCEMTPRRGADDAFTQHFAARQGSHSHFPHLSHSVFSI